LNDLDNRPGARGLHQGYCRPNSRSNPKTTARAALPFSRSISDTPKVLRTPPGLGHPVGALEFGEHQYVEKLGANRGR